MEARLESDRTDEHELVRLLVLLVLLAHRESRSGRASAGSWTIPCRGQTL